MTIYAEIQYSVNEQNYFKLKQIIEWCKDKQNYEMSKQLLKYISDNKLTNLEKDYYICYIRYIDFIKHNKGKESDYKYLGYSLTEKGSL